MTNIHEVLEDSIRAVVLAQVTRHGGSISAKEISINSNIPLTTVYYHLNALEKDRLIIAKEVRVRNLNKKVWERSNITIEDVEKSRVFNKHYKQTFSKDPSVISSMVRFFNAFIREDLVLLDRIEDKKFSDYQEESLYPLLIKLYGINKDDYKYALTKLTELREELFIRAERRGDDPQNQRISMDEEEQYILFLFTLPNLKDHFEYETGQ